MLSAQAGGLCVNLTKSVLLDSICDTLTVVEEKFREE